MNPSEMVVIIVALGILGGIVKNYFDSRGDTEASGKERKLMVKRMNEMEERIRVLERIVTEEDFDLKRQFRDLDGDK
ncbi:MAG TPA: hypothetical protein EYP34_08910 [Chromatiaceae bacterium]|nr:hypothetical protein [Chromatiaceae bacterium]